MLADTQSALQEKARLARQREERLAAERNVQAEIDRMNREGNALVVTLGELAWKRYPEVAPFGIIASRYAESKLGVVDYDEFFVVKHETKTIPAEQTGGRVYLRFRRRVTRDGRDAMLWHFWEPGYAATKPEMLEEMLPVVRAHLAVL